jgi:hypothetical protein
MGLVYQVRQLSLSAVLAGLFASWLVYLIGLAVYRLYLSPLAKFPGPKIAAFTKWYEFYYEVVKRGQYQFLINDMHKKYGKCRFPDRVLSTFYSCYTTGNAAVTHHSGTARSPA